MKASKPRSGAALKAWQTRRSPTYRAAKTETRSKEALRAWAASAGFHLVLLDAPSGKPRTGIIDALLIRHATKNADSLEVFAVQLKGGGAGMIARETSRLRLAADQLRVSPLVILHDGAHLHFLPAEPARKLRRKRPAG